MKWASIKATRNPTADEMRRWGHLAKLRVYQQEMERHNDPTIPHLGSPDSVHGTQRASRQRDKKARAVGV